LIGWFVLFWFVFIQLPLAYYEVSEYYPETHSAPIYARVTDDKTGEYMVKASMFLSMDE